MGEKTRPGRRRAVNGPDAGDMGTCESHGEGYGAREPMLLALVPGENGGISRPLTAKAAGEQAKRTRKHAEVFTPARVCSRMVNHCNEK